MPDITFANREAVPAELQAHIKEVDGKIVVNVVPKATLDGFRDNNVKFLQERDDALAKSKRYEDVVGADPMAIQTELAELRATAQLVKDGKLTTSDAVKRESEARIAALQESLNAQIKAQADLAKANGSKAATLEAELNRAKIDRGMMDAILAPGSGVNPSAAPDILERAMRVFTVSPTGTLVPKQGDTIIYGSDGASPMSPKEWLAKLLVDAPHFGKISQGGGAGGDAKKTAIYGGLSEDEFMKLAPEVRMERFRQASKKSA